MKVLLIVYDNDSFIHWFPQGLAYIASALRNAGHDITVYNQDQYHYPESHLKEYLTQNPFDVVGVSVIAGYYQYRKLLKISEAINSVPDRPFYVIGGHGPAPEPAYFLKKTGADADIVIIDKHKEFKVEAENFVSLGKNTPFDGWVLKGMSVMTICKGRINEF